MECVRACLNIIWACMEVQQPTSKKEIPLKFWALENPYHGFLKKFIGKPAFTFDPWEFGDAYKKRTALWGNFNEPIKKFSSVNDVLTKQQQQQHKTNSQPLPKPESFGVLDRQARRSITPEGFSKAFFLVNQ